MTKANSTRATNGASRRRTDYYGDGCRAGNSRAQDWIVNPHRGNPLYGGTLQYVVLDLAARFRDAKSKSELEALKGEIVGFCYALECPIDASACLEKDAKLLPKSKARLTLVTGCRQDANE